MILAKSFFNRHTVEVAKDLLGKYLCVVTPQGDLLSGVVSETEAYRGFDDDACHAHKGKTPRCEVMYGSCGHAYVYFTYGLHHMLNLVTEEEGFPAAVLIRGIVPKEGEETMSKNRYGVRMKDLSSAQRKNLTNGPAKVTQAMGITVKGHNGTPLVREVDPLEDRPYLTRSRIWVEDRGLSVDSSKILTGPRVGIDYAVNSKDWPWRFILKI